jgi:uncharacterized protein YebE (UPF0316 family)
MENSFFDTNLYSYVVLPLIIMFARIVDVTIGTMRIIFVSKGQKRVAPILGFFEVFIWIIVIGQIMANLNNWACYFGYALGFAFGNYVGMRLEEYLAVGKQLIRIIAQKDGINLVKNLNNVGFGATLIEGEGSSGKVQLIYTIVNRENMAEVLQKINEFNPKLFYTIEDIKKVSAGIFPNQSAFGKLNPLQHWRKGK